MLFIDNNRYLPLTGLLTLLQSRREIFKIFQKYFTKYFMKYFTPKTFMKFYITSFNQQAYTRVCIKRVHFVFVCNYDVCQPIFIIFGRPTLQ